MIHLFIGVNRGFWCFRPLRTRLGNSASAPFLGAGARYDEKNATSDKDSFLGVQFGHGLIKPPSGPLNSNLDFNEVPCGSRCRSQLPLSPRSRGQGGHSRFA